MDIESIIELQKIDCNCNDCIYMVRDGGRYKKSLELHKKWQYDYFELYRQKTIKKAQEHKENGDNDKYDVLMNEVGKMKFQFDKTSASVHYGHCNKFDKEVTFIPATCQLHTQSCFLHRRQL